MEGGLIDKLSDKSLSPRIRDVHLHSLITPFTLQFFNCISIRLEFWIANSASYCSLSLISLATMTNLLDFPNELILHILSPFTTQSLLNIAPVSHRIHSLIYRLILNRLCIAANPPDHTLLLECYHPSAKLTEPALYCTYLSTPGLPSDLSCNIPPPQPFPDDASLPSFTTLRTVYSHFRPQRRLPDRMVPTPRHPAGDVPGSRTHPTSSSSRAARLARFEEQAATDCVRQVVNLEGHELFTQLCANANLVRPGPRRGLFGSIQQVEEGVVRIWREWLGRVVERGGSQMESVEESSASGAARMQGEESILWIDAKKNVGLRVRVYKRDLRRSMPVLWSASEDDVAVSYEIEYQGRLFPWNWMSTVRIDFVQSLSCAHRICS